MGHVWRACFFCLLGGDCDGGVERWNTSGFSQLADGEMERIIQFLRGAWGLLYSIPVIDG